jgi:hypothetical protein
MVKELLRARIITGRVTSSVVFAQCVRFIGVMPRLDRGIQYAAACPLNHNGLGVLDRPVKPGDDTERVGARSPNLAQLSHFATLFPLALSFGTS